MKFCWRNSINNKILFIGNSYSACISEKISDDPNVILIVGSGDDLITRLEVDKKGLSLSHKKSELDEKLWRYKDKIIPLYNINKVVILGFCQPPNGWNLSNCFLDRQNILPYFLDRAPISFNLYSELNIEKYYPQYLLDFVKNLKENFNHLKFLLVPKPHFRVDIEHFTDQFPTPRNWKMLDKNTKGQSLLNEIRLYDLLAQELGFQPMKYPSELIVDGNRCPVEYSHHAKGSYNFLKDDINPLNFDSKNTFSYRHKNDEYGEVIFSKLIKPYISKT